MLLAWVAMDRADRFLFISVEDEGVYSPVGWVWEIPRRRVVTRSPRRRRRYLALRVRRAGRGVVAVAVEYVARCGRSRASALGCVRRAQSACARVRRSLRVVIVAWV